MYENKEKAVLESVVLSSNASQVANSELGITQEYNKANRDRLWDSQKGKANFKEKQFGDRNTYEDAVSGKTLHKSQNAAQNKYHMRNVDGEIVSAKWAEHSAETDHITAIKDAHEKVKGNAFLSDSDFKEIVNSEENYRLTSKSLNASKGEKSDWELVFDKESGISTEGKLQLAKEKVRSDLTLTAKFAARTGQNMGKEFLTGAKDTLANSAIPLTVEAVNKLIQVAQGKEKFDEAAKDMAKTTINIAVAGGANRVAIDFFSSQFANSNSVILKNIAGKNQVGQIVAVALIVQESALQYINGDIDGKEFIQQVGTKGTTMVAGMIGGQVGREIGGIIGGVLGTFAMPGMGTAAGMVVGEVIGQVLGTIITTVACSAILSTVSIMKHIDDYKNREHEISRITEDAIKEITHQRMRFKEIVEKEYKKWDDRIQEGFNKIILDSCEENFDIQGITEGIDELLSVFGRNVRFSNVEEYKAQLDKPLII